MKRSQLKNIKLIKTKAKYIRPAKSQEQQDLERLLSLLDLSVLHTLNNKSIERNYGWGHQPLLTYTTEALTEYATTLYPHVYSLGCTTMTEAEYLAQWLAPEHKFREWFTSKEAAFIGILADIVANPMSLPAGVIDDNGLHTSISDFLTNSSYFEDLSDFLCSEHSPLRLHAKGNVDDMTDQRVVDLIAEVDAKRAECNADLVSFIGQENSFSQKIEELYILSPDKDYVYKKDKVYFKEGKELKKVNAVEKVRYTDPTPRTIYGKELKRCRKLMRERLDYYRLTPSTLDMLTAHKDQISVSDWDLISKALDAKRLTSKVRTLIAKYKKVFKPTKPSATASKSATLKYLDSPAYCTICADIDTARRFFTLIERSTSAEYISLYEVLSQLAELAERKTEQSAETIVQSKRDINMVIIGVKDLFICSFTQQLGGAYAKLKPVTEYVQSGKSDDMLNSLYAVVNALYAAQNRNKSNNTVKEQQSACEAWYCDFSNIHKTLAACLQIALNGVSPSTVLSDEALSHGAIKGMLAFGERLTTKIRSGAIALDYPHLAKDLHDQISQHTNYFLNAAPIPEIVPTSKGQLLTAIESTAQQAKTSDKSFRLTKTIQRCIDVLKPTVVFTDYVQTFLSADQIKMLVPVPDRTITQLLLLAFGRGTTPYMLDGALYAHTADDQYIKIVPEINKDGYASYKLTAVNYKALNTLIDRYCALLRAIPAYEALFDQYRDAGEAYVEDDNTDDIDAEDLRGDAYTLTVLNSMLKARVRSTQKHLSLVILSDRLASQARMYAEDKELLEYLQIVVNKVYKDLERPYYVPFTKYYDPPYRISGHSLSAWVYYQDEYTSKITNGNGDYQVDHITRGFAYRSDNRPDNLRIVPADYNQGRTSRSIEVTYGGDEYVSLSAYVNATNAGNYDALKDIITGLQLGETVEYKNRLYMMDSERRFVVTDSHTKATRILYDDTLYPSLAAFAKSQRLSPDAVRQARRCAKKAGSNQFRCGKYTFCLEDNGDIKITL